MSTFPKTNAVHLSDPQVAGQLQRSKQSVKNNSLFAICTFQTKQDTLNLAGLHLHTCIVGNPIPTRKFAHQFMRTAMDIAAGRGPCENNSAVIIHGIDPGPTAKKTT